MFQYSMVNYQRFRVSVFRCQEYEPDETYSIPFDAIFY